MRFDHWLHWVPDRASAVAAYQAAGLHVVVGGEHPGWGTHNALCHFGLPYVEVIAFHDASYLADPWPILRHGPRLLTQGGGVGNFALAVPDMAQAVAELRGRGYAVGEPQPGARQRPDGSRLCWETALLLEGPDWRPFLIAWGPDEARLEDLRARGVAAPHPLGDVAMDHAVLACTDPAGDARWLGGLVRAEAYPVAGGWRVPLPGCDVVLTAGSHGVPATDLPRVTRLVLAGGAGAREIRLGGWTVAWGPDVAGL